MLDGWRTALLFLGGIGFQLFLASLVLLRPPRRQSSALAWILVILMVPVVGALAFFAFGDVRLGSRRRGESVRISARVRSVMSSHLSANDRAELPERWRPIGGLAYQIAETDPRGGNLAEPIGDTNAFIDALVRDIDDAREHVHLVYYIYLHDGSGRKVAEALMRAVERGVACRLLVDAVGSMRFLESRMKRELDAAGVRVVAAMPTRIRLSVRMDLRNHRKIAVIDGLVGYTGSHNIAAASFALKPKFAPWVDATLRLDGPIVRDLQELFVEDWYLDTDESFEHLLSIRPRHHEGGVVLQVLGTGPASHNDALIQLIQASFHLAREELILTTPYFVPDEGTRDALATAALRGVKTKLVVPARNDSFLVGAASRSYYEPLLAAGVEIHEYTKGLLHAKTITIDRDFAVVSTANLDRRSFELNSEASLAIFDSDLASRVRFLQQGYIDDSRAIDAARWARRGTLVKISHNAAGVLSPIL